MGLDLALKKGIFQKRYKRFFADIEFEGQTITAHCPNTGSMMGLTDPGLECLFSTSDDPNRKLKHTLQMIKAKNSWVGVNTGLPNKLVAELFNNNPLPHWQKFDRVQQEVKINAESRIDLVLWNSQEHSVTKWTHKNLASPLHLIEVKNVTLAEDGLAMFPDAVTTRGLKHLEELIHFTKNGYSCEMVFVIQRTDCTRFKAADHIDPAYAAKLLEAQEAGVKITPLPCAISTEGVHLTSQEINFN